MDISDILVVILPKDIYQIIIFYGFIYFLLIFYGSEQWKSYSSFEKVGFSIMSGYVVWVFFVFPISFFTHTLNIFQHELPEIKYADLYQYIYIFSHISIYLFIWKLLFSNKPLRDNKTFFNFTKYLIIAIIVIFFTADYLFMAALLFSGYQEYIGYSIYSFLYLCATIIFYMIFLEIYGEKIIEISKIDGWISFIVLKAQYLENLITKNKKRNLRILGVIVIIVVIAALFGGKYYLKTTTQFIDERSTKLEIPRLEREIYRDNITGYFDVVQNYKITFRLIPWVKFSPNISFSDESGKPYDPERNYNLKGDYITINGSSWNTTNVTLYGKRHEDNLPKIYNITKKYFNDSIEVWDINFIDPYEFGIVIRQVSFKRDNQLEYINHSINNLITDENGKIQLDNDVITFNDIVVSGNRGKSGYANQSIAIYFKKNNG